MRKVGVIVVRYRQHLSACRAQRTRRSDDVMRAQRDLLKPGGDERPTTPAEIAIRRVASTLVSARL